MPYRISWKAFIIAVLLMFLATEPLAKGIRKRVKFPRGSSGVTLKGSVIRGDRDEYLLKAGRGQLMKVTITSEEDNAVFQVYAPNQRALKGADEGDDARQWNGKLPLSGDYKIMVGGTRGNATYSLSIEIE